MNYNIGGTNSWLKSNRRVVDAQHVFHAVFVFFVWAVGRCNSLEEDLV